MLAPVTLDLGGSPMSPFVLQDTHGLAPLKLPEALLDSNRLPNPENKNLPQPSSDAIRRFQAAMESQSPASVLHAISRSAAEPPSRIVEGQMVEGRRLELASFPEHGVSHPEHLRASAPLREMTIPALDLQTSEALAPTLQSSPAPAPNIQTSATLAPDIQPSSAFAPDIQSSKLQGREAPDLQTSSVPAPNLQTSQALAPDIETAKLQGRETPTLQSSPAPAPNIQTSATLAPDIQPSSAFAPDIQSSKLQGREAPDLQTSSVPAPNLQTSQALAPDIETAKLQGREAPDLQPSLVPAPNIQTSPALTPKIESSKLQGREAPNLQSPTLPLIIPVSPEEAETLAPTKVFTSSEGTPLPYRIFMPDPTNARVTEPDTLPTFPLVLFMHGAGTRGDDGAALAGNICFRDLLGWAKKVEPAIVIAPQCPVDRQWVDTPWSDAKHVYSPIPAKYMAAALELLDTALAMLPVDHSRILVCGNSMGGYATWDVLARRPGLFAAALPVCGGGDPQKIVEVSHDVPIWAFHGDADKTVPVANSRNIVGMLEADPKRTAEIRYRELPGVGHDSWTDTFSDREVLSWFFAQQRVEVPGIPHISAEPRSGIVEGQKVEGRKVESESVPEHGVSHLEHLRASAPPRETTIPAPNIQTSETLAPNLQTSQAPANLQTSEAPASIIQSSIPQGREAPNLQTSEAPAPDTQSSKLQGHEAPDLQPSLVPAPNLQTSEAPAPNIESSKLPGREAPTLQSSPAPAPLREKDETDDIGRPDILPAAISNPLTQAVIPQATVATDEAAAVSARTEAIAETVSHVVEAVAATIVVEPSLKQGEGSVTIHLKPEVLDGSELRLVAQGGLLTLELTPATPTAEQMIARSVPQLEHALAGHIDAFHGFNVVMKRGKFDEAK